MQIYWNKRKRLYKKRVQLPQDWFGTPIWPPFHCFGTPIWPPWRHVKTLYWTRSSTVLFLRGPLRWLTAAKKQTSVGWATELQSSCVFFYKRSKTVTVLVFCCFWFIYPREYTFIAIRYTLWFDRGHQLRMRTALRYSSQTRGCQLGQEKRRRTFLRTSGRAAGLLLLKDQFSDLCECLFVIGVIGHKK